MNSALIISIKIYFIFFFLFYTMFVSIRANFATSMASSVAVLGSQGIVVKCTATIFFCTVDSISLPS